MTLCGGLDVWSFYNEFYSLFNMYTFMFKPIALRIRLMLLITSDHNNDTKILLTLAVLATFGLEFSFKTLFTNNNANTPTMKRATGIGGIFLNVKKRPK